MKESRRQFIRKSAWIGAGAVLAPHMLRSAADVLRGETTPELPATIPPVNGFQSRRPAPADRRFVSTSVERFIEDTVRRIKDPKLAWQFRNCFPCTLDTTVFHTIENGIPDTYVITGDIDAMWLRDSSAQVFPYLRLAVGDEPLQQMLRGLIARQSRCIIKDPYANAFNKEDNGRGHQDDMTQMGPGIWERKWEIDSLCYPVRLAYHYWKTTGDSGIFTPEWDRAMRTVYRTFREQQRPGGNRNSAYRFQRISPVACETLMLGGYGNPLKLCGLICSSFRPSDDATILPFLIPSNMFAVVSLRQMAEIYDRCFNGGRGFSNMCRTLAAEVDEAIEKHGVVNHPVAGPVYAYETDGYGNHYCMDDANVPSLLSIPYLGYCTPDDPLYLNTRRFIWSQKNPYYFEGKVITGIGGPHQGQDNVWPMSLIMYALTSGDNKEIDRCIGMVSETDAGTGFVHETVHKDDDTRYTRDWFAWANTLFGELIARHV